MDLALNLKLVDDIDCAADAGPERLVDTADSRVVESPLGRYREAGKERYSRFAYRFKVGALGAAHLLVISYPDDRERTMDIHISTPKLEGEPPQRIHPVHAQTGVATGGEYPISNAVHEHTVFFWPEEDAHAVIFMTWATGRPAAAQRIRVYEVQGELPPLELEGPTNLPARELGLCWEDASVIGLMGATEATPETWRRTVERLGDYMRFIGCDLMTYPVCIYDGPYYGSALETTEGLNAYRLAIHPGDWVGELLRVFEKKDLRFIASMTLATTPSLKKLAEGDEERLAQWARRLGGRSRGTPASLARSAGPRAHESAAASCGLQDDAPMMVSQVLADNALATEKNINTAGPQFDPIHPKVQEHTLGLVRELAERYGDSPAFQGVAINIWGASIFWFGTLEAGYGDYGVALFEQETGIRAPVDCADPQRFAKRHDWLLANAREAWIDWRCRKVADLFQRMSDILRAKRRDLRLVLSFFVPYGLTTTCPFDLSRWQEGKVSVYEMHREGGIDANLLRRAPGIVLDKILQPCDYRIRACNLYSQDRPWTPEHLDSRDLDFDPENLAHNAAPPACSAWLYNRYFESTPEDRKKVSRRLARGNARFEAGQWWDLLPGWTYGAVMPGHHNLMEWYGLAAATLDPAAISNGGLTIGTVGHEERVRRFARGFRALPALDFETVPGATDPVMIRQRQADGALYYYLVNQEPVAATVELDLPAAGRPVVDLADGAELSSRDDGAWVVELEPFGFRSFRIGSASARVVAARAHLPQSWIAGLRRKVSALQRAHAKRQAMGAADPADEVMARECVLAMEQGRWTRVRHLLQSHRAARITGKRPF